LALHVDATDATPSVRTSGVVEIQTLVDGTLYSAGPASSQTCTAGACALSADGVIDFGSLTPGEHTIEVAATDGAENVGSQTWTVEVGASPSYATPSCTPGTPQSVSPSSPPETTGQVVASLEASAADLLGDPDTLTVGNQIVHPSLTGTAGGFSESGTSTGAFIGSDGQGSFAVGGSSNGVCVSPVMTTSAATTGSLSGDAAAIFANSGESANSILRPTALGVEDFQQLLGSGASSSSWQVSLAPTEVLEQLDPQTVAVVDTSGVSNPTVPAENSAPATGTVGANGALDSETTDVNDQLLDESATVTEAVTQVTSGTVVAVLTAPSAIDDGGTGLDTTLTADSSTGIVNLDVAGTQSYPAVAALALLDVDVDSTANDSSSDDVGPPDGSSVTVGDDGYQTSTVTNDVGQVSTTNAVESARSNASVVPYNCKVTASLAAIYDDYPFSTTVRVGSDFSCDGAFGNVNSTVVNLHHKKIGSRQCSVTPTQDACSTLKTYDIDASTISYEMTEKTDLEAILVDGSKWTDVPSNCTTGQDDTTVYCSFSRNFSVADHRCDLTYNSTLLGDGLIPGPGDDKDRYIPVLNVAPFVTGDGKEVSLLTGFWNYSPRDLVSGFGQAHIQVKHGWDYTKPTPIYGGTSTTPNEDATRQALQGQGNEQTGGKFRYVATDANAYEGVGGVMCRRVVVIQPNASRKKQAGGIVTSFGATSDETADPLAAG
jgi:hypothetical protein